MKRKNPELNRERYQQSRLAAAYRAMHRLFPAEEALLATVEPEIRGGRILDLGVGAGRTTAALRKISPDYLGIDYSAEMVRAAKERTPEAAIRHLDARDLSGLDPASFDFVFFSFNGLDSVSHEDRMRILGNVSMVLKPGGWFGFSSHNFEGPVQEALRLHPPRWGGDFRGNLRELKRFFLDLIHYRRHRSREIRGEGFAILNDCAHHYSLLNYYVSTDRQKSQLVTAGFSENILCLDTRGMAVTRDRTSPWIHYLARKNPASTPAPARA